MSGLNLVPNPVVLAVQAGVFLTNIVVIKKLWINPYLKIAKLRKEKTQGCQQDTERLSIRNAKISHEIETKMTAVSAEIKAFRGELEEQGDGEREQLLKKARTKSQSIVQESREQLARELNTEFEKIPMQVAAIVDQLFKKIMA